jgi:hypothetical protein
MGLLLVINVKDIQKVFECEFTGENGFYVCRHETVNCMGIKRRKYNMLRSMVPNIIEVRSE